MKQAPDYEICLLTGALGSGKTTLLNALLGAPHFSGAMVLINEFGDIGLDHEIVREVTENVLLLSSGCLCCSLKGDLKDELTRVVEDLRAGHLTITGPIIIETTGLADPVPILQLINSDEILSHHLRIKHVVTVIDAANVHGQIDEFAEIENQIALADVLVISKTDIASASHQSATNALIGRLNPFARRVETGAGAGIESLATALTGPSGGYIQPTVADSRRGAHDQHCASSFVFDISGMVPRERFYLWVQLLVQSQGERLLRMKGVVPFEDGAHYVHSSGPLFHPPEPVPERQQSGQGKLICITRNLDEPAVRKSFRDVCLQEKRHSGRPFAGQAVYMPPEAHRKPVPADVSALMDRTFPRRRVEICSPYLLWGVHNPWSVAAQFFDAWSVLEMCENDAILTNVRCLVGDDINLIDTEIVVPATPWLSPSGDNMVADPAGCFPVDPDRGLVCRLPLGRQCRDGRVPEMILHRLTEPWSIAADNPWAELVLYYADSRAHFDRDDMHAANIRRDRRRPLANVAVMPIWRVSGGNGADNNYATGFNRPRAEWLANSVE